MSYKHKILVVDDDECILDSTASIIDELGYEALCAANGQEALDLLEKNPEIKLTFLDLRMPVMNGMETLKQIKQRGYSCGVIIMTAHGDIETAAEVAVSGAQSFVEKPCFDELPSLIEGGLKARAMIESVSLSLPGLDGQRHSFATHSEAMRSAFTLIEKVVSTDTTVLIEGESGTGKGILAEAIHHNSQRRNKRFVTLNCASIPRELMESEMFGHEKGSFTGADSRRIGKFEFAAGGTLFLDEIGEMPLELQAKLLRVVQEKVFERVGGNRTIRADVRIVAATNRDLRAELGKTFREDLFWRLNVVNILLPPLRDRVEDIIMLSDIFVVDASKRHDKHLKKLTPIAEEMLLKYKWPGNIRELKNAVEHAVLVETGDKIQPVSFPASILSAFINDDSDLKETTLLHTMESKKIVESKIDVTDNTNIDDIVTEEYEIPAFDDAMRNMEIDLIKRALTAADGNVPEAARKLSLELRTLQRKIKKYREKGLL